MTTESHYTVNDYQYLGISNTMLDRIHNYVDICKDMVRSGIESHGRTLNFTFAIRKGKVAEIGWNDYRKVVNVISKLGNLKYYNPLEHKESNYKPCLHSEMACLTKLGNSIDISDFSDYDLVNIRINRTNKMNCVLSAPCCNCRQAIRLLNIRKIYFYDGTEWKCIRGR